MCDDDDGGAGAGTGLCGTARDEGGRIHGPVPPRATGACANERVKASFICLISVCFERVSVCSLLASAT